MENNLNMPALYIGVVIYFACMIMVGFLVRKKASSAEGYLVAGRQFTLLFNSAALTACFLGGDMGLTDRVKQGGFPMVDVTHDGHDRRTMNQRGRIIFNFRDCRRICFRWQFFHSHAEFAGNQASSVKVDFLIDRRHDAQHHQFLDHFIDFATEFDRQFFDGQRLAHFDMGRPDRFLFGCGRRRTRRSTVSGGCRAGLLSLGLWFVKSWPVRVRSRFATGLSAFILLAGS